MQSFCPFQKRQELSLESVNQNLGWLNHPQFISQGVNWEHSIFRNEAGFNGHSHLCSAGFRQTQHSTESGLQCKQPRLGRGQKKKKPKNHPGKKCSIIIIAEEVEAFSVQIWEDWIEETQRKAQRADCPWSLPTHRDSLRWRCLRADTTPGVGSGKAKHLTVVPGGTVASKRSTNNRAEGQQAAVQKVLKVSWSRAALSAGRRLLRNSSSPLGIDAFKVTENQNQSVESIKFILRASGPTADDVSESRGRASTCPHWHCGSLKVLELHALRVSTVLSVLTCSAPLWD